MSPQLLLLALRVLWPSFLVAVVAEGCFFSLFAPEELLRLSGWPDLPPIACYTIGFFFFWIFCALASTLTFYLAGIPETLS